jgi:hypothetical protein
MLHHVLPLWAYGAALAVALFAIWFFGLDHDWGGYPDGPFTIYRYRHGARTIPVPDKLEHLVLSALLMTAACYLVAGSSKSLAWFTWGAGVGYELVQALPRFPNPAKPTQRYGYASPWDMAADLLGILIVLVPVILAGRP